jgi:hypothetical protein
MPYCAANRARARALPGRSTISPTRPPVKGVGGREVQPEGLGEGVGDLREAAADDAAAEAQPLQRADERAGAGREDERLPHLVEDLDRQTGQDGDAGPQ